MPQFFVERDLAEGSEVEIRGSEAHHIASVLRLAAGDWLVLSDGRGHSYLSTIVSATARSVTVRVGRMMGHRPGPPPPALAIASIRGERLEWAVQKCVELGCRLIIPFDSARTVRRRAPGRGSKSTERLSRIALEAAKQSGLPFLPEVEAPLEFADLIDRLQGFSPRILLYEGERARGLHAVLREGLAARSASTEESPALIVGPEGGFTADEVEIARSRGAITSSLGSQILRVETAAVAAMAICQYELGNMDPPEIDSSTSL